MITDFIHKIVKKKKPVFSVWDNGKTKAILKLHFERHDETSLMIFFLNLTSILQTEINTVNKSPLLITDRLRFPWNFSSFNIKNLF